MQTVKIIPAPTGGIDSYNNSYGISLIHAYSLINWIPGLRECYVRGGSSLFYSPGSETIDTLMVYNQKSLDKLFVVMDGDLYDVGNSGILTKKFDSNLTESNLNWIQINTEGGQYLMFFNGNDTPKIFNGTTLTDVSVGKNSSVSTAFPTLSNLIWCHVHQNRLWFGEKNSLDCWYMPISSITGNSAKLWRFNATKGGYIMGMFSWTINSVSSGSQDVFCFITSEGELFIYSGNPDTLSTIEYIGTYQIGKPVSRRAWCKFGGDVLIFTDNGVEAVSQIFGQGQEILDTYEFQKFINPLIKEKMEYYNRKKGATPTINDYNTIYYDNVNDFIILTFAEQEQIIINIKNRSAAEFNNLDMRCVIVFENKFLYGDNNGNVLLAYSGDADYNNDTSLADLPIRAVAITSFQTFDFISNKKKLNSVKVNFRSPQVPSMGVDSIVDYDYSKSLPVSEHREFDIDLLGGTGNNAFVLGTSYLLDPQGLSSFTKNNLYEDGYALATQLVVERFGYEVNWISSEIKYKQSIKES